MYKPNTVDYNKNKKKSSEYYKVLQRKTFLKVFQQQLVSHPEECGKINFTEKYMEYFVAIIKN